MSGGGGRRRFSSGLFHGLVLVIAVGCLPRFALDGGAGPDGARDTGLRDGMHLDLERPQRDGGRPDVGYEDERGFFIRVPMQHTFEWDGWEYQVWDADRICTLDHQDLHGFTYVQLSPVPTSPAKNQRYVVDGAWRSVDGVVEPIEAQYNAGNHFATGMTVWFGDRSYGYGHSSFEPGSVIMPCQPWDCLVVRDLDSGALLENGCTEERTLPAVCVVVRPDGTVPELVDTFQPCD